MDLSFDIFQIYRQYCDLGKFPVTDFTSRTNVDEGYEELQKARIPRDALSQLLKLVESKVTTRVSILEEIYKLMSRLDLTTEFSEFLRFYDFVFFICRENGQKSITVSRAVMAWRLVLSGRFRLLNQWCNFVEKNQRHNISEDTWRQVLAFSRCVHENLEGYDPEGAWPVLIDDFVEFMYRIRGSAATPNLICNCSDLEAQQREDTLPGLKIFPGSKRKLDEDIQMDEDSSDVDAGFSGVTNTKRRHVNLIEKFVNLGRNHVGSSEGDSVEIVKQNTSPLGSGIKSNCSVEGCLSRGFAELLSGNTRLQFDHNTRVPYT